VSAWAERKKTELLAKLASVDDELAYWWAQAGPTGVLAKHHTQLARMAAELTPVVARVRTDIDAADLGASWPQFERQVLDLHRVWDFFREKLALRYVDRFADYLLAADEFAWACYEPMQQVATAVGTVEPAAVREPPLVCFTPVSTPFSIPRGASYTKDVGGAALVSPVSRALAQRLPIPVVGVPWYQLHHLPDALVIGHEVGHHVERDARLTATVQRLVAEAAAGAGAGPEHRSAWDGWAAETFADVYGVLCGGPAFAHALADFLVVAGAEHAANEDYPPVKLRVALTVAALEAAAAAAGERDAAETSAAITELRSGWADDGVMTNLGDQAPEVAAVASALVAGPYPELGGVPLTRVVGFGAKRLADHRDDAAALLDRRPPGTNDARTLMAAAGRAYAQDPQTYQARNVPDRVLRRMRPSRHPASARPPSSPRQTAPPSTPGPPTSSTPCSSAKTSRLCSLRRSIAWPQTDGRRKASN
jgi:hypothetical protein